MRKTFYFNFLRSFLQGLRVSGLERHLFPAIMDQGVLDVMKYINNTPKKKRKNKKRKKKMRYFLVFFMRVAEAEIRLR